MQKYYLFKFPLLSKHGINTFDIYNWVFFKSCIFDDIQLIANYNIIYLYIGLWKTLFAWKKLCVGIKKKFFI